MVHEVAIIGDNFMQPERFAAALRAACGAAVAPREMTLPWPDAPMEHGYARPGMDGLKEYQGGAEEILRFIDTAPILLTHLAPVSGAMLERLPSLRMIAVSRGGPVNIDMKAAAARGVLVVNTPGRNASAVAEFTIGAILAETRLIRAGHESLRAGQWRGDLYRADLAGRELNEMAVGVIGYGHVGTRVVALLKPFGCRILVCDPYVQISARDHEEGVVQCGLDRVYAEADVVSLHPRVTAETTGMIDGAALARMKRGAYLINTARGPLMDYDALIAALESGHIAGAALDTFAIEPAPADWKLLHLPNVTVTPHIAGASVRTITVATEAAAEEVRRFIAGQPPRNPCNLPPLRDR